ncbi:MAG: RusA family crossover junction endodeoxyribonuclease [Acidimicrobiales bacterium]
MTLAESGADLSTYRDTPAADRPNLVRIVVLGTPSTQGSKSAILVGGRPRVVEAKSTEGRRKLSDWRSAIAAEARTVMAHRDILSGPVSVGLDFRLQRPASAPKRRRTWPVGARSGDVDKLARAAFDALTGVVFGDDSQVVVVLATKDYGRPGVVITVDLVPDETVGA